MRTRTARSMFGVVAALLMIGCADSPVATLELQPPPETRYVRTGPAWVCDTSGGQLIDCGIQQVEYSQETLGPLGDSLYEAPNPPPGVNEGIWLGPSVTPQNCFFHLMPGSIADADSDWLADHCELELAKAFAPSMRIDMNDGCSRGEPHWAAKFFLTGYVRIAYMPAYYDDCGPYGVPLGVAGGGHHGDSEYIMVEVIYDVVTSRWKFHRMFLSAHYGEGVADRSRWVTTDAQFAHRPKSHPIVWVARAKHANYPSFDVCNQTTVGDGCGIATHVLRMPVLPTKNVGSAHVDTYGCQISYLWFPGGGRQECFFQERPFHGWYPSNPAIGVTPYATFLRNLYFEHRCNSSEFGVPQTLACYSGNAIDPGPGPSLPPGKSVSLSLSAPESGVGYVAATASGSNNFGANLYYTWYYNSCADMPNCTDVMTPSAAGYGVTSLGGYIGSNDYWFDFRVDIRLGPGQAVLAQQSARVLGPMQIGDGGYDCGGYACVRGAPSAAPKKPRGNP